MNDQTSPAEWSSLLIKAVNEPGTVSKAYRMFWNYSTGNQMLAVCQCMMRSIEVGPINTFKGWQSLGRNVRKGQKAIELCMPITCKKKVSIPESATDDKDFVAFSRFVYRKNWFVLSQTDGKEYQPAELPEWSESAALATLEISRIAFEHTNGNVQGFAIGRSISISPIAAHPIKTMLHEIAHVVLGHTAENAMNDDESTSRNIREVEAESVAMIVAESLDLPGSNESRGYIQSWIRGDSISNDSARRIFKAADLIVKAGRTA